MPKILIVDDDRANREMLARYLTLLGYRIVVALNGAQAVMLAHTEQPDLILMDMRLPVMDGWEATRQIKAGATTGTIAVMALTASAMDDERQRCLEAGCDDYETKPLEFPRLLRKLRSILSRTTS
jgi:two-component system cell cycle response regulator DivK